MDSRAFEIFASSYASSPAAGRLASEAWLRGRSLWVPALTPWHVEIALDVGDATPSLLFDERKETRFRIEVYSSEWGVFFCHEGRASWIRVTDIAFVHGRDDFKLLTALPPLQEIGSLLRAIERQQALHFRRELALVRTNLPNAEREVRSWVRSL